MWRSLAFVGFCVLEREMNEHAPQGNRKLNAVVDWGYNSGFWDTTMDFVVWWDLALAAVSGGRWENVMVGAFAGGCGIRPHAVVSQWNKGMVEHEEMCWT